MLRYSYILLVICYTVGFVVVATFADWQDAYAEVLNDDSNKDFLNSLDKLKRDFEAYNFDTDRTIPWKELKASMEVVSRLRDNYGGSKRSDLFAAEETIITLMDDYRRATKKMFRWAAMGRETFNFLNRRKDELKNMDRIRKLVRNLLNSGKSNIEQTVNDLNEITESLISLEFKLKRTAATIRREGVFIFHITVAGTDSKSTQTFHANRDLVEALDKVIDQIGTLKSHLNEKVVATRTAMETEVNYVEELYGKANELRTRSHVLMLEDLFELIFDDFDKFATSLNEYVIRHGGGDIRIQTEVPTRGIGAVQAQTQSNNVRLGLHGILYLHTAELGMKPSLETEFLEMTNNVNAYVDRMERSDGIELL